LTVLGAVWGKDNLNHLSEGGLEMSSVTIILWGEYKISSRSLEAPFRVFRYLMFWPWAIAGILGFAFYVGYFIAVNSMDPGFMGAIFTAIWTIGFTGIILVLSELFLTDVQSGNSTLSATEKLMLWYFRLVLGIAVAALWSTRCILPFPTSNRFVPPILIGLLTAYSIRYLWRYAQKVSQDDSVQYRAEGRSQRVVFLNYFLPYLTLCTFTIFTMYLKVVV
jgi:hypothetical protein